MSRRPNKDMELIAEEIAVRAREEEKNKVISVTANQLAKEFGISENTVAKIFRQLGYEFDNYFWYKKG